jgi:hypothetical protein
VQQPGAEHDAAGLASLAPADADQPGAAVDVPGLQGDDLADAESGGVQGLEDDPVLEAARGGEEGAQLVAGGQIRQRDGDLGVGDAGGDLRGAQDVGVEVTEGSQVHLLGRRAELAGPAQVDQEGTDVVGAEVGRRLAEEDREGEHAGDVGADGLRAEVAQDEVVDKPLAKWGHVDSRWSRPSVGRGSPG